MVAIVWGTTGVTNPSGARVRASATDNAPSSSSAVPVSERTMTDSTSGSSTRTLSATITAERASQSPRLAISNAAPRSRACCQVAWSAGPSGGRSG